MERQGLRPFQLYGADGAVVWPGACSRISNASGGGRQRTSTSVVDVGRKPEGGSASVQTHEIVGRQSFSGAIAAAVTTPLDVVKTRLMLKVDKHGREYKGLVSTFRRIVAEEGAATLLSGIVPRVFWISIGGAFFLGGYQAAERQLRPYTG